MAVVGETTSHITGGKFANGAALGAFRYMFNDALHDPRLNGRGVPSAMGGDGKSTPLDKKSEFDVAVEKLQTREGKVHMLKTIRKASVYGAYGSAVALQPEGVAYFTATRFLSDWGISYLNGQDDMAIYRHSFIDVSTSIFPNPVILPAALFIRSYTKSEGDKYEN
jgi:hypothetical protein